MRPRLPLGWLSTLCYVLFVASVFTHSETRQSNLDLAFWGLSSGSWANLRLGSIITTLVSGGGFILCLALEQRFRRIFDGKNSPLSRAVSIHPMPNMKWLLSFVVFTLSGMILSGAVFATLTGQMTLGNISNPGQRTNHYVYFSFDSGWVSGTVIAGIGLLIWLVWLKLLERGIEIDNYNS